MLLLSQPNRSVGVHGVSTEPQNKNEAIFFESGYWLKIATPSFPVLSFLLAPNRELFFFTSISYLEAPVFWQLASVAFYRCFDRSCQYFSLSARFFKNLASSYFKPIPAKAFFSAQALFYYAQTNFVTPLLVILKQNPWHLNARSRQSISELLLPRTTC